MNERSASHATFVIRRSYAATPTTPATVFHAFADPATKRRWFVEGEGWTVDEFTSSFEVGGREYSRLRFGNGPVMCNDTIYLEIVANRRIVFSYTMTVAGRPISASLGTLEFAAEGEGTRLNYTEQAAPSSIVSTSRANERLGFANCFRRLPPKSSARWPMPEGQSSHSQR